MLVHAAGESASSWGGPLPSDTHAIVLAVPSEAALEALGTRLAASGPMREKTPSSTGFVVIEETDGAFAGQKMAIGLAPCRREDLLVRRCLSSLPLLK